MKQKKRSAKAAIVILVGLVLAGVAAIASEYGTQADPLVSQSYIDSVFAPQLLAQVDSLVSQKLGGASNQIQTAQDMIDQKIAEFESRQLSVAVDQAFLDQVSNQVIQTVQDVSVNQSTFQTVSLSAGQQLVLNIGAEALLQSGSASCLGGLVDTTTGAAAASGAKVQQYHLYLASQSANGMSASSAAVLLVRGSYTVR